MDLSLMSRSPRAVQTLGRGGSFVGGGYRDLNFSSSAPHRTARGARLFFASPGFCHMLPLALELRLVF